MTREEHKQFEDIMNEMKYVYLHDDRPWMIGFSGGKDSTMLCCLVMNMLKTLSPWQRKKNCTYCFFRYNGRKSNC